MIHLQPSMEFNGNHTFSISRLIYFKQIVTTQYFTDVEKLEILNLAISGGSIEATRKLMEFILTKKFENDVDNTRWFIELENTITFNSKRFSISYVFKHIF